MNIVVNILFLHAKTSIRIATAPTAVVLADSHTCAASLRSAVSFPSMLVLLGPTVVQLSNPHVHPLGQHAPPTLEAQLYHPVAQVPLAIVVAAPVNGTTIVTSPLTSVVDAVDAQSVVWQSWPMRQQLPPG